VATSGACGQGVVWGGLHLLLNNGITKKDDFLIFVIHIHFRKPFQTSFAGSSGESGSQKGGFNDQCNCGVDNLDIVCHNQCLKLNETMEIINRPQNYSILRQEMPVARANS
jgi:hypothetical protein